MFFFCNSCCLVVGKQVDRHLVALTQTHGSRWVGYQGGIDYVGPDFTASLTLANPDIISKSGVAVAQYLQSFTQR